MAGLSQPCFPIAREVKQGLELSTTSRLCFSGALWELLLQATPEKGRTGPLSSELAPACTGREKSGEQSELFYPRPPSVLTGDGGACPHSSAGCWGDSRCQLSSSGLVWALERRQGGRTALQDKTGVTLLVPPAQSWTPRTLQQPQGKGGGRGWGSCASPFSPSRAAATGTRFSCFTPTKPLQKSGGKERSRATTCTERRVRMVAAPRHTPHLRDPPHLALPWCVLHDDEWCGVG